MMMTKPDAEKIAQEVHAARPDWDTAGILAALGQIRDRGTIAQLREVALAAAIAPGNRTPRVIALEGPHWDAARAQGAASGPRKTCETHEIELSAEGVCRCCRADRLVSGEEHPIGPKDRSFASIEGRCCGTSHPPGSNCPGHVPPPVGWRRMVEASIAHYAQRAPDHMKALPRKGVA